MKFPFAKKPATPTATEVSGELQRFLTSLSIKDKMRVAAAVKTKGELELRMRFAQDGTRTYSVWLGVPGCDDAFRLVPAPADSTEVPR